MGCRGARAARSGLPDRLLDLSPARWNRLVALLVLRPGSRSEGRARSESVLVDSQHPLRALRGGGNLAAVHSLGLCRFDVRRRQKCMQRMRALAAPVFDISETSVGPSGTISPNLLEQAHLQAEALRFQTSERPQRAQ